MLRTLKLISNMKQIGVRILFNVVKTKYEIFPYHKAFSINNISKPYIPLLILTYYRSWRSKNVHPNLTKILKTFVCFLFASNRDREHLRNYVPITGTVSSFLLVLSQTNKIIEKLFDLDSKVTVSSKRLHFLSNQLIIKSSDNSSEFIYYYERIISQQNN